MEEGVTIAKVPDWMELKPEMMPHLIRELKSIPCERGSGGVLPAPVFSGN